jgi:hypothetical protein
MLPMQRIFLALGLSVSISLPAQGTAQDALRPDNALFFLQPDGEQLSPHHKICFSSGSCFDAGLHGAWNMRNSQGERIFLEGHCPIVMRWPRLMAITAALMNTLQR